MMRWYWHLQGKHVHVRVFINGGKCGDLCFRAEEFKLLQEHMAVWIDFIDEGPAWPLT